MCYENQFANHNKHIIHKTKSHSNHTLPARCQSIVKVNKDVACRHQLKINILYNLQPYVTYILKDKVTENIYVYRNSSIHLTTTTNERLTTNYKSTS